MKLTYKIKLKDENRCEGCRFLRFKWLGTAAFCWYFHDKDGEGRYISDTGNDCKKCNVKRPSWCKEIDEELTKGQPDEQS